MIIHLGANIAVNAEQILLFVDIQQGWTVETENMVRRMQEKHQVYSLSPQPKTFVLCQGGQRTVGYLSGVGLRTLQARAREDRAFFLRLMRRERGATGRSEVQHDKRD